MTTSEEEEEPLKVTILLPKDTLFKLDQMMKSALLGSRGRTIQALVDEVWEAQTDLDLLHKFFQEQDDENITFERFLRGISYPLMDMWRRIGRFRPRQT